MASSGIPARPTLSLDLPATFHGIDPAERKGAAKEAIKQVRHLGGQFELLEILMDFYEKANEIEGWEAIKLSPSDAFLDMQVLWPGEDEKIWLIFEMGLNDVENVMEQAQMEGCSISEKVVKAMFEAAEPLLLSPKPVIDFIKDFNPLTDHGASREDLANPAAIVFPKMSEQIHAWEQALDMNQGVDSPAAPGMRRSRL